MATKVKPQSKETFSHWTIISTLGIIVAIVVSFPCIPKAPEQKQIPEPTASFSEVKEPLDEIIPPKIMRQTIDIPKSKIEILMPQMPALPTAVPYIPIEEPFLRVCATNAAPTKNLPSNINKKENSK